jgi:hypothetical protein
MGMVTVVPFPTMILFVTDPSGSVTGAESGKTSSTWAYMYDEEDVRVGGEMVLPCDTSQEQWDRAGGLRAGKSLEEVDRS